MNNKNIIAHIADLHIRFGSRHEEYKKVFTRLINDLQEQKPRRIVIAGDIFHLKINLSPASIDIAGSLLRDLSLIAPVDIIIGNHDFNEQDLSQGDAISPLIELLENGFIITKENQDRMPIPREGYGVFFYKESGFYNVEKDLVYGVYSMLDREILNLTKKEKGKTYVSLFHGIIYGCINDNGYQMKGDELLKLSTFNNFDIAMFGDVHEYQAFERNGKASAGMVGSLIQQNYGESLNKGYLIWNLDTCEHERRFILNDYGFCKLNITKGEIIEERLEDLQFSFDKKKTRIYIEIEDDAENENLEKKSQIRKWIKDRHGCDNITIEFKPIKRDKTLETEEDVAFEDSANFEKILTEWHGQNEYDNLEDVIELSRDIDSKIDLESKIKKGVDWDLNKMETFNIFSHPAQVSVFDFDKLSGITGIFGKNYSGKSNIIKILGWGLYEKIIGGGESHKVVNLYTGLNKAWVRLYLTISGVQYRIERGITVTPKKDGTTKAAYSIKYEYLTYEDGNELWVNEESDRAATEKKEFKKLIIDSIGTFEDFTKVCLQTQGGKDDYLSLQQQPKNDLIRKFFGLELFDLKYEFANDTFKQIKATQKSLGDPAVLEKEVEDYNLKISEQEKQIERLTLDKKHNEDQIDTHNKEILDLTKKLKEVENTLFKTKQEAEAELKKTTTEIESIDLKVEVINEFLASNFIKEIPAELKDLKKEDLESKKFKLNTTFQSDKTKYITLEKWIKENPKKEAKDIEILEPFEDSLLNKKQDLINLNNDYAIAKGEKCPTCKQFTKVANPEAEKTCLEKITALNSEIEIVQNKIAEIKKDNAHVHKFDSETNVLNALKNTLQQTKLEMDGITLNLSKLDQIQTDLVNNKSIKAKGEELNTIKDRKIKLQNRCKDIESDIVVIDKNFNKVEGNKKITLDINALNESIKEYKIALHQTDTNIKDVSGEIKVIKNNIALITDKLTTIKDSIRIYAKYSVYLQAVSRDGIPAQIIKKKLPLCNYRINAILASVVNFKIDMFIKPNGDVQEMFYFSPDKTDALPLSMGSGSQKFVGSIAITDALHAVSCLMKPNLRIIDEGFGTLDEDKTADIGKVFSYLRNRYKNILIITHRTEIKDFVDNIIQVSKTTSGLSEAQIKSNPEAGISQFSLTC